MNNMKKEKYRTPKDELPRLAGAKYATGEEWRKTPERMKGQSQSKKQYPVVDVMGDGSKVQSYKEQYCIGT